MLPRWLVVAAALPLACSTLEHRCPPVPACPSGLAPSASARAAPSTSIGPQPPQVASSSAVPPLNAEVLFDKGAAPDGFLPRAQLPLAGIDNVALTALINEAESSCSDSLLVIRDGQVIAERYFGKPRAPIETMSVTKSFASLAIGMLIADGKIAGVDEPVSRWYPEWKTGPRARVTLRHLLTHSAALEHRKGAPPLNARKDRLAAARELKPSGEPGKKFSYSNEGTMLLSGIIASAAGKPVDALLDERLFKPLGIKDWAWDRDTADNVQTYYGLALHARDLARVGMMMLDDGRWKGATIVPQSWVAASTSAGGTANAYYGLLWWLRPGPTPQVATEHRLGLLREHGFTRAEALSPLLGKVFPSEEAWWIEAGSVLDADTRTELLHLHQRGVAPFEAQPAPVIAYYADGWLGQKLAVYPKWKLIVVRQHRRLTGDDAEKEKCGFASFHKRVEAIVTSTP